LSVAPHAINHHTQPHCGRARLPGAPCRGFGKGEFLMKVIAQLTPLLSFLLLAPPTLGQDRPAYEQRNQPVTKEDLQILQRADKILSSEAVWNRQDTRVCQPEDKTWSLFCALQKASIEVLGSYDHRRVALQEVRFVIEELAKSKDLGGHRLMGYNNLPSTQFKDIKKVLKMATERVAARLKTQQHAK
jgi:hypothetical protein